MSEVAAEYYDLVLSSLKKVSIFRPVLQDSIVGMVVRLMEERRHGFSDSEEVGSELFAELANIGESAKEPLVGNAWQNHMLNLIIESDNAFSLKAEQRDVSVMGDALVSQVEYDLSVLKKLFDIDMDVLLASFPSIDGFNPLACNASGGELMEIKQVMLITKDWQECIRPLAEFYGRHGAGEFGRYRAFRWVRTGDGARLRGVASPDSICLSDLFEYGWQRAAVKRNTEKLLAGLSSNNLLLYGDRGTGKSSTVKAMLNEFPESRLRLLEVSKENLSDLPEILSLLRERPEKFILFLDDLSFEEHETEYKALKAVLEGGLEGRPVNVVLYATSNRRNLIKERFQDALADEEVHPGDTVQEQLSLSDRFGLKLPFLVPDMGEYLNIVGQLAARVGIEVTEDIKKQAMNWQHARSGRSARQFVDYITGERALES